jgi:sulfur carrier protein
MNIIVNGKSQELDSSPILQHYIEQACPNPKRVIAEVNESIVKRAHWSDFTLKSGDKLELVTFVGGG